jgi:hypothetical protein
LKSVLFLKAPVSHPPLSQFNRTFHKTQRPPFTLNTGPPRTLVGSCWHLSVRLWSENIPWILEFRWVGNIFPWSLEIEPVLFCQTQPVVPGYWVTTPPIWTNEGWWVLSGYYFHPTLLPLRIWNTWLVWDVGWGSCHFSRKLWSSCGNSIPLS